MIKTMSIIVKGKQEVKALTDGEIERYLKLEKKLSDDYCDEFNIASALDIDADHPGMLAHVVYLNGKYKGLIYTWPQGNYLICGGARQAINRMSRESKKVYELLVKHLIDIASTLGKNLFFREASFMMCSILLDMGFTVVMHEEEVPEREGLTFLGREILRGNDYILSITN